MAGIKQIDNPAQAYALGATWGTPSVDNTMSTEWASFINNTGLTLYTGDIVCLDATGTLVNQPTTATLAMAIGCVGNPAEMGAYPAVENIAGSNVTNTFPTIVGSTGGTGISALTTEGNMFPFQDYAWQSLALGFTNGSATVTYGAASAAFIGQYIITPYNSSTNANPQIFQIVSFVASTSFGTVVVAGAGTTFSGTTGTFTCQVGRDQEVKGPGWSAPVGWTNTSGFVPGLAVPVVTKGYGRVNCNAAASTAAGGFLIGTNASFAGTFVASGSLTAAQIGFTIAVPVEAYAQRDTTLTTAGIAGHDSVRAIIGKM